MNLWPHQTRGLDALYPKMVPGAAIAFTSPTGGGKTRCMTEMAASSAPQLAFPAQNSVTGKLRQAAAKAGKPDFLAMWAGQAAPLSRALPAAELVARLEAETLESIQKLKGVLHES